MLQLTVIMIGKQIADSVGEIILPKIKIWLYGKKLQLGKLGESRMAQELKLVENEGLNDEYLKLVLQIGFITMFVSAFPLAPLLAFLNNLIEVRLDAKKFVCDTRRCVSKKSKGIGIWHNVLTVVANIAVITNSFLIPFRSEFIEKQYYFWNRKAIGENYIDWRYAVSPNDYTGEKCYYPDFRDDDGNHTTTYWTILLFKFGFAITFQLFVFGIVRCIELCVPEISQKLKIEIKRKSYLENEILVVPSETKNLSAT